MSGHGLHFECQKVLPDKLVLKEQQLAENAKFKNDNFGSFQTMWT